MLKHLPSDALTSTVTLNAKTSAFRRSGLSARNNNSKKTACKRPKYIQRPKLFQNQLKNEYVYRIPLRYFLDIAIS